MSPSLVKRQIITFVLNWLAPPIFDDDEEKSFRARLLNNILVAVFIFMVIVLPVAWANKNISITTKIVDSIILCTTLFLWHWLHQGKVNQVGHLLVVAGFVLITILIAGIGTLLTPTTSTYMFMVIIAGILFGFKGIIVATFSSSFILAAFVAAQYAGIFGKPVSYAIDFPQWLIYVLLFGLAGGLTNYSLQATTRALQRSRQAEADLRVSEARFRNLFEQTHDAVFIATLDRHYITVNNRAVDLLGYTIEAFLELSVSDISFASEELDNMFARLLTGEHIPHFESAFVKKDGTVFPVEIYLDLIRNFQGAPQYMQIVARDISQRKKAEEALDTVNGQLIKRVMEVELLHQELREQAIRDPLTGLYNRRFIAEMLPREIARMDREQISLGVIILDIDFFKQINDTYGHPSGDKFLVEIARLLKNEMRSSDIVCRYGGEEFLLVLPGANIEMTERRAEEIRCHVGEMIVNYEGHSLKATISLGLAEFPDHGITSDELVMKADRAMYFSKQSGRNRLTTWNSSFEDKEKNNKSIVFKY